MGVYYGTTEITNVDWIPGDKDITQAFFGNTEVFTVWATYDGSLPAQYSANGDYLADYRIYGASGGCGDRTENLFEVDMSVRSANLLSWEDVKNNTNLNYTTGLPKVDIGRIATENLIDVSSYTDVTVSFDGAQSIRAMVSCFTADNTLISRRTDLLPGASIDISSAAYVYVCFYDAFLNPISKASISNAMLNAGSTPLPYQPYSSTTTPIYIGDTPLGEDEYVSFKEQKVYRMVNGVLTPTDPPVPLPALPTVDGINVVDYAGQSAAVPSRFYAKYRKEGF